MSDRKRRSETEAESRKPRERESGDAEPAAKRPKAEKDASSDKRRSGDASSSSSAGAVQRKREEEQRALDVAAEEAAKRAAARAAAQQLQSAQIASLSVAMPMQPTPGGPPVGSWQCTCGSINYPNRLICSKRNCWQPMPGGAIAAGKHPPGSWICGVCKNVNFPTRTFCNGRGPQGICGRDRGASGNLRL
eukprot:TRINITY_DN75684_c0_g1_i1.p1 TRINITY_DN75684_c0_g1~~TRINITY_DN75684_c0_g1_i1.p1  ORF type:complete len:191 (-),score=40.16 TRINITY_DN75684_c0_g1_i1:16-588(-)